MTRKNRNALNRRFNKAAKKDKAPSAVSTALPSNYAVPLTIPALTVSLVVGWMPNDAMAACVTTNPDLVTSPVVIDCVGTDGTGVTATIPGPDGGVGTGLNVNIATAAVVNGPGFVLVGDPDHGPLMLINAGTLNAGSAAASAVAAMGEGRSTATITNSRSLVGSISADGFTTTTARNAALGTMTAQTVQLDSTETTTTVADPVALTAPAGTRNVATTQTTGGASTFINEGTFEGGPDGAAVGSVTVRSNTGSEVRNSGASFATGALSVQALGLGSGVQREVETSEVVAETTTVGAVTTAITGNSTVTTQAGPTSAANAAVNQNTGTMTVAGALQVATYAGTASVTTATGTTLTANSVSVGTSTGGTREDTVSSIRQTVVNTDGTDPAPDSRVTTVVTREDEVDSAIASDATLANAGTLNAPTIAVTGNGGGDASFTNTGTTRARADGLGEASVTVSSAENLVGFTSTTTVVTNQPDISNSASVVTTTTASTNSSTNVGGDASATNGASATLDATVSVLAEGNASFDNGGTVTGDGISVIATAANNSNSTSSSRDVVTRSATGAVTSQVSTSSTTTTVEVAHAGTASLTNSAAGDIGTTTEEINGRITVSGDAGATLENDGDISLDDGVLVQARGQFVRNQTTDTSLSVTNGSVTTTTPSPTSVVVTTVGNLQTTSQSQSHTTEVTEADASLVNGTDATFAIGDELTVSAGNGQRFSGSNSTSSTANSPNSTVTTTTVTGAPGDNPLVNSTRVVTSSTVTNAQTIVDQETTVDFTGGSASIENAGELEVEDDVTVAGDRGASLTNEATGELQANNLTVDGSAQTGLFTGEFLQQSEVSTVTNTDITNRTSTPADASPATVTSINDGGTVNTETNRVRFVNSRRAVSGDASIDNGGDITLGGRLGVAAGGTEEDRLFANTTTTVSTGDNDAVTVATTGPNTTRSGVVLSQTVITQREETSRSVRGIAGNAQVTNSGTLDVSNGTVDIAASGTGNASFANDANGASLSSRAVTISASVQGEESSSSNAVDSTNRTLTTTTDNDTTVVDGVTTDVVSRVTQTDFDSVTAAETNSVTRGIGGAASFANDGDAAIDGNLSVAGNSGASVTTGEGSDTAIDGSLTIDASNTVTTSATTTDITVDNATTRTETERNVASDAAGVDDRSTVRIQSRDETREQRTSTIDREANDAEATLRSEGSLRVTGNITLSGNSAATIVNGTQDALEQQVLRGAVLTAVAARQEFDDASESDSRTVRTLDETTTVTDVQPIVDAEAGDRVRTTTIASTEVIDRDNTSSSTTSTGTSAGNASVSNAGTLEFNQVSVRAGGANSSATTDNEDLLDQTVTIASTRTETFPVDEDEDFTDVTVRDTRTQSTTVTVRNSATAETAVAGNATLANTGNIVAPRIDVLASGGGNASATNSGDIRGGSPSAFTVSAEQTLSDVSSDFRRTVVLDQRVRTNNAVPPPAGSNTTTLTRTTTTVRANSSDVREVGGDASVVNAKEPATVLDGSIPRLDANLVVQADGDASYRNEAIHVGGGSISVSAQANSTSNEGGSTQVITERDVDADLDNETTTTFVSSNTDTDDRGQGGTATVINSGEAGSSTSRLTSVTVAGDAGASLTNSGQLNVQNDVRITASGETSQTIVTDIDNSDGPNTSLTPPATVVTASGVTTTTTSNDSRTVNRNSTQTELTLAVEATADASLANAADGQIVARDVVVNATNSRTASVFSTANSFDRTTANDAVTVSSATNSTSDSTSSTTTLTTNSLEIESQTVRSGGQSTVTNAGDLTGRNLTVSGDQGARLENAEDARVTLTGALTVDGVLGAAARSTAGSGTEISEQISVEESNATTQAGASQTVTTADESTATTETTSSSSSSSSSTFASTDAAIDTTGALTVAGAVVVDGSARSVVNVGAARPTDVPGEEDVQSVFTIGGGLTVGESRFNQTFESSTNDESSVTERETSETLQRRDNLILRRNESESTTENTTVVSVDTETSSGLNTALATVASIDVDGTLNVTGNTSVTGAGGASVEVNRGGSMRTNALTIDADSFSFATETSSSATSTGTNTTSSSLVEDDPTTGSTTRSQLVETATTVDVAESTSSNFSDSPLVAAQAALRNAGSLQAGIVRVTSGAGSEVSNAESASLTATSIGVDGNNAAPLSRRTESTSSRDNSTERTRVLNATIPPVGNRLANEVDTLVTTTDTANSVETTDVNRVHAGAATFSNGGTVSTNSIIVETGGLTTTSVTLSADTEDTQRTRTVDMAGTGAAMTRVVNDDSATTTTNVLDESASVTAVTAAATFSNRGTVTLSGAANVTVSSTYGGAASLTNSGTIQGGGSEAEVTVTTASDQAVTSTNRETTDTETGVEIFASNAPGAADTRVTTTREVTVESSERNGRSLGGSATLTNTAGSIDPNVLVQADGAATVTNAGALKRDLAVEAGAINTNTTSTSSSEERSRQTDLMNDAGTAVIETADVLEESLVTRSTEQTTTTALGSIASVNNSGTVGLNTTIEGQGGASLVNSGKMLADEDGRVVRVTTAAETSVNRVVTETVRTGQLDGGVGTTSTSRESTSQRTNTAGDASVTNTATGIFGDTPFNEELVLVEAGGDATLVNAGFIEGVGKALANAFDHQTSDTLRERSETTLAVSPTGQVTVTTTGSESSSNRQESTFSAGTAVATNQASGEIDNEMLAVSIGGASASNAGIVRALVASTRGEDTEDSGPGVRSTVSTNTFEEASSATQVFDSAGVELSFNSTSGSDRVQTTVTRGTQAAATATNTGLIAPFDLVDFEDGIDDGDILVPVSQSSVLGGSSASFSNSATGVIIGDVTVDARVIDTDSRTTTAIDSGTVRTRPVDAPDSEVVTQSESIRTNSTEVTTGGNASVANSGALGLELEEPSGTNVTEIGGDARAVGNAASVTNSGALAGIASAAGNSSVTTRTESRDFVSTDTRIDGARISFTSTLTLASNVVTNNTANGTIGVNNTGTIVRGVTLDGQGTGDLSFQNTGTLGDEAREIIANVTLRNHGVRTVTDTRSTTATMEDRVQQMVMFDETVDSTTTVEARDVAYTNSRDVYAGFRLEGANTAFVNEDNRVIAGDVVSDALFESGTEHVNTRTERTTTSTLAPGAEQIVLTDVTQLTEQRATGGSASVSNVGDIEGSAASVALTAATVTNSEGAKILGSATAISRSRDRVREANTVDGFETAETTVGGLARVTNAGFIGRSSSETVSTSSSTARSEGLGVEVFGASQSVFENSATGKVNGDVVAGSIFEHEWLNTVDTEAVDNPVVTHAAAGAVPAGVTLVDPYANASVAALVASGQLQARTGNSLLGSTLIVNDGRAEDDVVSGALGVNALVNRGFIGDDIHMAAFQPTGDQTVDPTVFGFVNRAGGVNILVNSGVVGGDVLFAGAEASNDARSSGSFDLGQSFAVGGDTFFMLAANASVLGSSGEDTDRENDSDCGSLVAVCFDVDFSRNTMVIGTDAQVGEISELSDFGFGSRTGGIRFGGEGSSNLLTVATGARIYGDISAHADELWADTTDTRVVFDVQPNRGTEFSYRTLHVEELVKTGGGTLVLNHFVERERAGLPLQNFSHDSALVDVQAGTLAAGQFVVVDGVVTPFEDFAGTDQALLDRLVFSITGPNGLVGGLEALDRDYGVFVDGRIQVGAAGTLTGELTASGNIVNNGRLLPGAMIRRTDGPLSNLTTANDQLILNGSIRAAGNFEQSSTGTTTIFAAPALARTVALTDAEIPEPNTPPVFSLAVTPWTATRDAQVATSQVLVNGNATVAGRVEVLTTPNALYRNGDRYDFLVADGTVTATGLTAFGPSTTGLVSFTPSTRVEGGKTILSATAARRSYGSVIQGGGNRASLATALDSAVNDVVTRIAANQFATVADFNAAQNVATTLAGLDALAASGSPTTLQAVQLTFGAALDELGGGFLGSLLAVDPGRTFLGSIDRRVAGLEAAAKGDRIEARGLPGSVWVQPVAMNEELDSDGDVVGLDIDGTGASLGYDFTIPSTSMLVGVAASRTKSEVQSNSGPASNADFETTSIGAYASTMAGNVRIDGSLAFINSNIDTNRQLSIFNGSAKADFDSEEVRLAVGLSYDLQLENGAVVTPSANLVYRSREIGSYSEAGIGGAGLSVDDVSDDYLSASLGVSMQRSWKFGELGVTPVIGLDVQFDGGADSEVDARLNGSTGSFQIEGVERDTLFVPHAGVIFRYGKDVEVYVNGSGAFGSDQDGWQILGGIRVGL